MHGTDRISPEDHARERAQSIPLTDFDVSHPNCSGPIRSGPISTGCGGKNRAHAPRTLMFGPYWSVTKCNDIMDIETNHAVFSSASSLGGITIRGIAPNLRSESFIAMDQPRHSAQRKTRGADVHANASTSSRSTSASVPPNASTIFLSTTCSTGSTRFRSNSPRRCSPCRSTSPGKPPQADAVVRRRDHAAEADGLVATEEVTPGE